MLFFSLGRSGSKNKWKTSLAWRWGEEGLKGLWCIYGVKTKLERRSKERLQKTSHFPPNLGFQRLPFPVFKCSQSADPGKVKFPLVSGMQFKPIPLFLHSFHSRSRFGLSSESGKLALQFHASLGSWNPNKSQ